VYAFFAHWRDTGLVAELIFRKARRSPNRMSATDRPL